VAVEAADHKTFFFAITPSVCDGATERKREKIERKRKREKEREREREMPRCLIKSMARYQRTDNSSEGIHTSFPDPPLFLCPLIFTDHGYARAEKSRFFVRAHGYRSDRVRLQLLKLSCISVRARDPLL